MTININTKLFTTYNINLSAVLLANGIALKRLDKGVGNKVIFCFQNSQKLQDISNKFWGKELKVEPQHLFDSLKFLKNRLYSNLEDTNGI